MKTYLVTGAAGFIGANYIKYILAKHSDIKVVVLDALTYAGNLGTIAKDIDNERCFFIKGDICSREVVDSLFAEYRFDYVVNFAAESHVDRSIENPQLFLITNILGTQNLLDCARRAWVMGKDEQGYPTWRKGVRYHQVSTDEVYGSLGAEGYFTEETPLCPHSPYSASKTSADMVVMAYHDTYKMPVTITRCSNNYGPYHFPEKLFALGLINCNSPNTASRSTVALCLISGSNLLHSSFAYVFSSSESMTLYLTLAIYTRLLKSQASFIIYASFSLTFSDSSAVKEAKSSYSFKSM